MFFARVNDRITPNRTNTRKTKQSGTCNSRAKTRAQLIPALLLARSLFRFYFWFVFVKLSVQILPQLIPRTNAQRFVFCLFLSNLWGGNLLAIFGCNLPGGIFWIARIVIQCDTGSCGGPVRLYLHKTTRLSKLWWTMGSRTRRTWTQWWSCWCSPASLPRRR